EHARHRSNAPPSDVTYVSISSCRAASRSAGIPQPHVPQNTAAGRTEYLALNAGSVGARYRAAGRWRVAVGTRLFRAITCAEGAQHGVHSRAVLHGVV